MNIKNKNMNLIFLVAFGFINLTSCKEEITQFSEMSRIIKNETQDISKDDDQNQEEKEVQSNIVLIRSDNSNEEVVSIPPVQSGTTVVITPESSQTQIVNESIIDGLRVSLMSSKYSFNQCEEIQFLSVIESLNNGPDLHSKVLLSSSMFSENIQVYLSKDECLIGNSTHSLSIIPSNTSLFLRSTKSLHDQGIEGHELVRVSGVALNVKNLLQQEELHQNVLVFSEFLFNYLGHAN